MSHRELEVTDSALTPEQSEERINQASKRLTGFALSFCGTDALSAYISLQLAAAMVCAEVEAHVGEDDVAGLTEWIEAKVAADVQIAEMIKARRQ